MTGVCRFVVTVILIGGGAGVLLAARAQPMSPRAASRTVVVAELFTSEGCSSCPPADDLLRRLVATQPVDGVEVVALGSHVDYWDRLGWRDPFSSPLFSARQSAYDAAVFRSNRIYTPQLVVDGAFETVGSDATAVRRTILRAAQQPKMTVHVRATAERVDLLRVDVMVDVPPSVQSHGAADVLVAVTEDHLVSRVQRGENSGRTLPHSAVVRSLTIVGQLRADARRASVPVAVPVEAGWQLANLRIVALVQESINRRILGAGTSGVSPGR